MFQEILAVAILLLTSDTFAQNLEAILCDTRLPNPVHGMPVVYDGEDSIHVMGGRGPNGIQQDILKFNVTGETIEKVGTMDRVMDGSAVWMGNENILYFGGLYLNGSGYNGNVWSFKPDGVSYWTKIGSLPRSAGETSSVWNQGEYSYVFGGFNSGGTQGKLNTILRYSSVTNDTIVVGELPGPRSVTSSIWDGRTGDAYIFGGSGLNGYLTDIVKFNPTEETVVTLNVSLPERLAHSCGIWTGSEVYIIGGYAKSGEEVRFNPYTNEVQSVPVNQLPADLYSHGCAFVKKLNRIYVFGGFASSRTRDEILFIDLSPTPTNPTTTTPITTTTQGPVNPTDCFNEVDGTRFLNPYCCESYYQCENKEAVRRHCPSQLQFNPTHEECDLPEIVKCRSVYA